MHDSDLTSLVPAILNLGAAIIRLLAGILDWRQGRRPSRRREPVSRSPGKVLDNSDTTRQPDSAPGWADD